MGQYISNICESVSKRSWSTPCFRENSLFPVKVWLWSVLLQRNGDRRVVKEVTDDTFGSLRQLLYSFPPPHQKRNAVYQSYYIHINGQTRAGNQFVVNKLSNQVLLFNCPFVVGFLYCRNKCRWAGHHSSGTKPN